MHTIAGPREDLSVDIGLKGYADGYDSDARFNSPSDLVMDDNKVLFVSDTGNHCIRKVKITIGETFRLSGLFQKGVTIQKHTPGVLILQYGDYQRFSVSP